MILKLNLISIPLFSLIKKLNPTKRSVFFVALILIIITGTAIKINADNSQENIIIDNQPFKLKPVDDFFASSLTAVGGRDESNGLIKENSAAIENGALMPFVFESENPKIIATYTVQSGDSLFKIAAKFNITPNTIAWANNLQSDKIKPGDKLTILPITGVVYKTQKDEDITSVAKKFKADAATIADFNNLAANQTIKAGQEIIIPDGVMIGFVPTPKTKSKIAVNKKTSKGKISAFLALPEDDNFLQRPLLTGRVSQGLHARNGIDIAAPCGTPIFASAPGKINRADSVGWNGGFGKNIVLYHNNGAQTIYGHLSKIYVKEGEYIPYNKIIGLVGNTGRSTGCHLHFETHGFKNPYSKFIY